MAISEVSVCNLALARIGRQPAVTSLRPPDNSQEALACGNFYDIEMANICNEHDWSFLTVQTSTLSAVTNPSLLWSYAFALPSNFMQMIGLYDANALNDAALYGYFIMMDSAALDPFWLQANTPQQLEFAVEADNSGHLVLYCNVAIPLIKYQAFPLIGQAVPPLFVDAFIWKLAASLAGALIRDDVGVAMASRCMQAYEMTLSKATTADCNNTSTIIQFMPFGIRARY